MLPCLCLAPTCKPGSFNWGLLTGRGSDRTLAPKALPVTHRATRSSRNNTVISAAMAFSRQRKYRHDKSKLIFHDFTCCLIIVCHGDPRAGGCLRCQGAGLPPGPGRSGGHGGLLRPPPPSPCVGSLGEVFAHPGQMPRRGLGGAERPPTGRALPFCPRKAKPPALQGSVLRSTPGFQRGEAQPPGRERGARGTGVRAGWEEGGEARSSDRPGNRTKPTAQQKSYSDI